jgi:hypothetical protein
MAQSPERQLKAILSRLSTHPFEEVIALATSHPETVGKLAVEILRQFPKGGTFFHAALSFLPQEEWPQLVEDALGTLEEKPNEKNEAADSVIAYASLQSPSSLHAHLDRIFELQPNAGTYYECYPWRESKKKHFRYLRSVAENASSSATNRTRAWRAMCQTREKSIVEYAVSHVDLKRFNVDGFFWSKRGWTQAHLHLVGFHEEKKHLRRCCPDVHYHLQFPDSFFDDKAKPPWLRKLHPTWKLPSLKRSHLFGGRSGGRCSLCKEGLHRLIVLSPVPRGVGVTGRDRLELATCLSCLGWERQPLFYKHDGDGVPTNIGYKGATVTPQFPVGPLKETNVQLAKTPKRWHWQDWALSNSRENLHRIGGEPCWVQDADYPSCPSCKKLMPYLMQLDSDLPTEHGGEWLWGSGGICDGFWCDKCKVSGLLWQCT